MFIGSSVIPWVSFTVWLIAFSLMLLGTATTCLHFFHRRRQVILLPPLSVLKPLKGTDPGLEENLRSFFLLSYPEFELLFSVAVASDPAVAVVQKLLNEFPDVKARLFVGEGRDVLNPKVKNMLSAYESAKYDWVLISDSNVRVHANYLQKTVEVLDDDVGLVSAVVAGDEGIGLGGALEQTFLNTFYARWMTLTAFTGQTCVVGKSMLFRKTTAGRFGGIETLALYLAEDYMAGEAIKRLGLRVVLMRQPVLQIIGVHRVRDFWARHVRWGRIRKAQAPLAFLFEPFIGALVSGSIGAYALSCLASLSFVGALFAHLTVWFVCDFLVMMTLKSKVSATTLLHWTIREFFSFPLWLHTAVGNSVYWRGKKFVLEEGGLLSESS